MNKNKMYKYINEKGLNHADTIAASEELDKEVLAEMLKDPKIENIIRGLRANRRVNDLAEVAVMLNETGIPAKDSVKLSVYIGQVKGI